MSFAYKKLKGLDHDRLLGVIEPVLRAHRVEGVELIWRTDHRGRLLYVTVERPGSARSGAGVTSGDCIELSRDLSTALDVSEAISCAYRLEVGTPGVERQLYSKADYERFAGQTARVKCHEPVLGQKTFRGKVVGLDAQGRIQLLTDQGDVAVDFQQIRSGQLVLDMVPARANSLKKTSSNKRSTARR